MARVVEGERGGAQGEGGAEDEALRGRALVRPPLRRPGARPPPGPLAPRPRPPTIPPPRAAELRDGTCRRGGGRGRGGRGGKGGEASGRAAPNRPPCRPPPPPRRPRPPPARRSRRRPGREPAPRRPPGVTARRDGPRPAGRAPRPMTSATRTGADRRGPGVHTRPPCGPARIWAARIWALPPSGRLWCSPAPVERATGRAGRRWGEFFAGRAPGAGKRARGGAEPRRPRAVRRAPRAGPGRPQKSLPLLRKSFRSPCRPPISPAPAPRPPRHTAGGRPRAGGRAWHVTRAPRERRAPPPLFFPPSLPPGGPDLARGDQNRPTMTGGETPQMEFTNGICEWSSRMEYKSGPHPRPGVA